MKRTWIFILMIGLGWAEGFPQTGFKFLNLGTGGRAIGMAEAYTGVAGGWESFQYNPAGLASLTNPELAVTHTEWLQGVRYENLGFIQPLKGGVVAGFLKGLYALGIERRDGPTPEPMAQFGFYGISPSIFYARQIIKQVSAGGGLTGIGVGADGTMGFGGTISLGLLYTPFPDFNIGTALLHLGPKAKWGGEASPPPTRLRLGIAWSPSQLLMSGDLMKELNSDLCGQVGLEYRIFPNFAIRSGYKFGPARDLSLCAGLGLGVKNVTLDYGYGLNLDLGHTHRLSFVYRWELVPGFKITEEFLARMDLTSQSFYKDGLNQMAQGKFEEAVYSFEKAIIWDPNNRAAQDQYEAARQSWASQEAAHHLKRGKELLQNGALLDALFELNHTLALSPELTEARLLLSSARAQIMRSLGETITNIEGKFERGLECYSQGEYGAAIKFWEEVLKESGPSVELKDYIELAKRRLALKVDSLLSASSEMFAQGEYRKSLEILSQAQALDPENQLLAVRQAEVGTTLKREVNQLLSEGIRYYNQKNYTDARRAFESALILDPQNLQARRYLDRIAATRAVSREELMEKHMAACLAYVNGDFETAIRYWEEILKIDPNFEEAQKNLKWAKARLSR